MAVPAVATVTTGDKITAIDSILQAFFFLCEMLENI
jgi:hypothetical protein